MSLNISSVLRGLGASDADSDFRIEGDEEESHHSNSSADGYSDHDEIPRHASTTESGLIVSSNDETFDDSSFPSIGYQEPVSGWQSGTLVEVYRDQVNRHGAAPAAEEEVGSFSGTIVSSAASEDIYASLPPVEVVGGPPSLIEDPYASRQQVIRYPLSISTTETEYRNIASLDGEVDATSLTASSLSFRPSLMETSIIEGASLLDSTVDEPLRETIFQSTVQSTPEPTSTDEPGSEHDREAFMNVATKLRSGSHLESGRTWFARFSERDWLQFQAEAEMILSALEPSKASPTLALPPEPPSVLCSPRNLPNYNAKEFLPAAFICSLCSDVIVGATTLSCGCKNATICMPCWEGHSTLTFEGDDGVVMVEKNHVCPACDQAVNRTVPCHAMDIAVLHCVKALPRGLPVQASYYRRLKAWRDEVLRRGVRPNETRDQLLAELIQREEEILWQDRKAPFWKRDRRWLLLGEVVLVAVGTLGALLLTKGRGPRAR